MSTRRWGVVIYGSYAALAALLVAMVGLFHPIGFGLLVAPVVATELQPDATQVAAAVWSGDVTRALNAHLMTGTLSSAELGHLKEVSALLAVRWVLLPGLVFAGALGAWWLRAEMDRDFLWGYGCTLAMVVLLGGLGRRSAFIAFHEVVFSGDNWHFKSDSCLIRLFPEMFWAKASLVCVFLPVLLLVLALSARRFK
jgi:hypothetical protein